MNAPISATKITKYLPDKYKFLPVTTFETIDSTNRAAKEMVSSGSPPPFIVVADSQSAGRGRLGRTFFSPASTGIYMSLASGSFPELGSAVFITSAAAVAVTDAIISLTGKSPGIKWVNDIYLGDKKICGILAESQKNENGFSVITGIGINMTTTRFPSEISGVAGSLLSDISREKMIAEITTNLLDILENPSDKSFFEKYKSRSIVIGKEIDYYIGSEKKTAFAIDIDDSGGLVVRDETGGVLTLSSGEITVRLK